MADDAKKQLFVYEHDAGRFELLVRILYWILIGIVLWIYGMITFLCGAIQWIHILILAQRHEGLSNFIKRLPGILRARHKLYVFHDRHTPKHNAGIGENF